MKLPFAKMPDHARLWVFASPEPLDAEQAERLRSHVESFLSEWRAHGAPVAGSYDWREDRFLLIAADEAATGVSGCSIDALTRTLKQAERDLGNSLVDAASRVWYRDAAGQIQSVERGVFRERVRAGEVAADTQVFDNTVATLGAMRRGEWERPMHESWHARAFGATRPA